jgi:hypothetical protein
VSHPDEVRSLASYYGVPVQREDEDDQAFRLRVIGALRDHGSPGAIIEAHELEAGRRFDDPDAGDLGGAMPGILGAARRRPERHRAGARGHRGRRWRLHRDRRGGPRRATPKDDADRV